MIESLFFKTENNNSYLYHDPLMLSLMVHPDLEKAYSKSENVDPYYLKKCDYLRKHKFFTKRKKVDFGTLDESTLIENITNTQQIVFETTDFCNLNCTYCSFGEVYEGFDVRNYKNINTDKAIKLLKYVVNHKHKSKNNELFISFYGGEPLTNMDFIKRIVEVSNQLKSEKELNLIFSMTTNATLIDKHIDFLVEHNFLLLVSIDGNEENHSYRVYKNNKNSFYKVIENLDMIKKDYPEYFANSIMFNAVLHNRNSVKEIYEFIYNRYHKIPRISELNQINIKPKSYEVYKNMYHSQKESEEEFQKEESELKNITHQEMFNYKILNEFIKYYTTNSYIARANALIYKEDVFFPACTCLPFGKKIYITNHGKLLPCEKINYKYALGEVDENIQIDIPQITHLYNSYHEHLKSVCQHCYGYRYCGVCMFRITNLDKLDTEDFLCQIFYDQKAFQKKLNRIFSFLEKYPKDYFHIVKNILGQ